MCTVMGTLAAMPRETFERSLARTHTRGPDAQRVLPLDGGGFLGFQRLAIMGPGESGMQPFCLGPHTAVCNGELYGFRFEKAILERGQIVSCCFRCTWNMALPCLPGWMPSLPAFCMTARGTA